ncbi:MAG: ATP-dependent Clp protease proteolytic subunit [Verrucomicrobiales bacterium]|nr:ATP-dependent Clp protease proteolytic subunit [Verrucomicrobiales bacterium]
MTRARFWRVLADTEPRMLEQSLRGIEVRPFRPQVALDEFREAAGDAFCTPVPERTGEPALLGIRGELLNSDSLVKLAGKASAIRLVVESDGGCCGAADRLLTALEAAHGRGATVETEVFRAGSAAALLTCCAPGPRTIVEGGTITLHTPWSAVIGGPAEMRRKAASLEASIERWVDRLAARTGQPAETCRAWLGGNDITFDPQAALDHGLVDEILCSW